MRGERAEAVRVTLLLAVRALRDMRHQHNSKYENILQAWTIFPEASGEGEMTMMLVAVAARKGRVTAKAKGKKLGHSLSGAGETGDGVQLSGNETAAQQI